MLPVIPVRTNKSHSYGLKKKLNRRVKNANPHMKFNPDKLKMTSQGRQRYITHKDRNNTY